ncbi:MAG: GAF domain-containing protein [candidate division Zixibacteria bacterium]|nr:GAF domain-containing protein [candidate division Zixibacteria bacterium]
MNQKAPRNKAPKRTATSPRRVKPTSSASAVSALKEQLEEKLQLLSETNRQLKRKIFDLYTIFEISRNFNSVLDYQTLLDTFMFTSLGQVAALKAAVFLTREGKSERFYLAKAKGSGALPSAEEYFSATSRLAAYLRRLNRPAPSEDLLRDVASPEEAAILEKFTPGLVVPLIYQTRLTGVFLLADRISQTPFREDDVEFLSILANQIAVAIENARLYDSERQATAQLRSAQQQLVQSEKLAALGEMSAKVAHEVNNPLGIIKNYLLLTRRSVDEQVPVSKSGEYLDIVGDEIDRIARIVKQLLELHRGGQPGTESVDIVGVLDSVLMLAERQLEAAHVTVHKDYRLSPAWVVGSVESFKQVFLNIVINARDAMSTGGTLTVTVDRADSSVVITLCDTGPGIPPEQIPRIFEPFFTAKDPGKGTGLGLSVCWGIVKSHNGSITFSNMNPGGCFEIRLPMTDGKQARDVVA